jgi:hypothetical protein
MMRWAEQPGALALVARALKTAAAPAKDRGSAAAFGPRNFDIIDH